MNEASFFARAFGEFRGRAFFVALGCLICQMGLGLTYIRTGMAPELIEGLGLSGRTELSGAATPQLIFQALASPLVGILAVRLGASRVLAISAALFAFVFFVFSEIQTLSHLYFVAAGIGLCAAGMGDITVGHVVSQWFHRNRGLALGVAYAGSNLGGSVMVALVSSVASQATWREGLLAIVPVALFVLLPTSIFLVREPDEAIDPPAALDEAFASAADDLDLAHALRTRSFWILTATLFTFFFFFTGILDALVLFLVDSGLSSSEARDYFRQAVGLGVVSKILGGFFADRIPQVRAVQVVYGILALSSLVLIALLFRPDPLLISAFVFSWGFSQACRDVVYPLVLSHCFGDRYLGEIYGAMTLTLFPGGALGPLFAAALYDWRSDYQIAFAVFAVLNVFAFLALLFVRNERAAR
ncbi:MAG: MFS transporter [bacterium]|nr:MFS transporter [bacterium]